MVTIYVLIVTGLYAGGFGFSQEFTTLAKCETAKATVLQDIGRKNPTYAWCFQK